MSTNRGHFEREYGILKKEFALLEEREKLLEEKLQSKPKVSRGKLQAVKDFAETQRSYESLLKDVEKNTSQLKETFGKLEKIIEVFYTNYL